MLPTKQLRGLRVGNNAPPAVNGAMWLETDANGVPLQCWPWVFRNGMWLSPEQQWTVSLIGQSVNSVDFLNIYRTILVSTLQIKTFTVITQNSSNRWSLGVATSSNNGQTNFIDVKNTVGSTINQWYSQSVSNLSTIIDPADSRAALFVEASSTGSPGALSAAYTVVYHFRR